MSPMFKHNLKLTVAVHERSTMPNWTTTENDSLPVPRIAR
jgi:hypothetical protein